MCAKQPTLREMRWERNGIGGRAEIPASQYTRELLDTGRKDE